MLIFLLVLIGGVLGVLIFTRNLTWGIILLIPITFFIPYELGTGTYVNINVSVLYGAALLGIWLLRMLLIDRQVRLPASRITLPVVLFAITTTLSLIAGSIQWLPLAGMGASLPAQMGGWLLYILPVGLLMFSGSMTGDLRWLPVFTALFLGLGGLLVASRTIPGLQWIDLLFVQSSLGGMFWAWLAALGFSQALFNTRLHMVTRFALILLVSGAFVFSWFYNREWVTGWMVIVIAVGVLAWLHSWRLGLILTLFAGGFILINSSELYMQVWTTTQQYSSESRLATWPIMVILIKASPILGLGPSNYYHYTPLFPLLGWYVKFNSHNNYVDLLASTGLLGLGIFLWIAMELARLAWRLRKTSTDRFSLAYVNGCLGGLVAMLASGFLGDWFLPFTYNVGFPGFRAALFAWIFLGGLVAIDGKTRKRLYDIASKENSED
jgi:hypothetical protein